MEYCSAIKKKILKYAATWIKLEDIMLNEISQSQKDTLYHPSLNVLRIVKVKEIEDIMVVSSG
jgi:hypothetical protein